LRPELRRSLALGAILALCLAAGTLWLVTRGAPAAPTAVAPTPLPFSRTPGGPPLTPVEQHALPATATPTPLGNAGLAPTATASPPAAGGASVSAAGTPMYFPVIAVPPPRPTPGPVNPPTGSDWRAFLAYYRAVAHLLPPVENMAWSDGAFKHARYLVENDVNTSTEDPALSWYTPEGAAAGPQSLWMVRGEANWNDVQTFDNWMRWPFHALSIIDPALASFGYGRYSEPGADPGPFHTGAVLDVSRGLTQPAAAYPVKWPDENTAVYLTAYDGGEAPDPLTSCPGIGLNGPAGLPVLLQLGPGSTIGPNTPLPVVTFSSFKEDGALRDHCIFDETSYQNSITSLRDQGRALLAARDAVVLIPRAPLTAGKRYTVTITALGQTHTWTFRVVTKP
jgi:hypothetical protein